MATFCCKVVSACENVTSAPSVMVEHSLVGADDGKLLGAKVGAKVGAIVSVTHTFRAP